MVRIHRIGKNISERFANRYYKEITVGLDFTARDIQDKLKLISKSIEVQKEEEANEAIIQKKAEEDSQENIVREKVYSKDEVERNIKIIDLNLSNNIAGQRELLLKKRKALKVILSEISKQ